MRILQLNLYANRNYVFPFAKVWLEYGLVTQNWLRSSLFGNNI